MEHVLALDLEDNTLLSRAIIQSEFRAPANLVASYRTHPRFS